MPKQNQMIGLMQMAWERSRADIYDFMGMFIGGAIFLAAWLVFSMHNYISLSPLINYQLPEGAIDASTVFIGAGTYGLMNACSILFFMFIIVCLADYTVTFVTLCYHYDNESWEIVKLANKINDTVTDWFRRDAEKTTAKRAERLAEIHAGISKIKEDETP